MSVVVIDKRNNFMSADHKSCHVVFLHNKLRKRKDDRYIIDLATGLKSYGHDVTIYTTGLDSNHCFEEVQPDRGLIAVKYSANYLPKSWYFLKAVIMAFRICLFPPHPKPKIVILDTNTVALFILSKFSKYKTILLAHFSAIKELDFFSNYLRVTPDLTTAISVPFADQIIVESECLGDVFRRSFPNYQHELRYISPCVDTGAWAEDCIDIKRIIPDLPENVYLFVVFGQYKKRSNFKLILDALESLWAMAEDSVKEKFHLVIGGNCKKPEELLYYDELIDTIKGKHYGSQISVLKQIPTIHKKSLLKKCTAVLIPTKHDPFPDIVIQALHMGRTIIATNTGFARYAITHRISGILLDPDPNRFAAAMIKVITNPMVQTFICEMAADVFRTRFSFDSMANKINSIIQAQLHPKKIVEKLREL